jgi:hypothetical protein
VTVGYAGTLYAIQDRGRETTCRRRTLSLAKERQRIAVQRAMWAALPELGPGFVAAETLKKAMLDRAWELLDRGEYEACDALLEFIPEKDAKAMLNEYFKDE